jgi:hypothetical protein
MNAHIKIQSLMAALLLAVLTACSGGSGESVQQNAPPDVEQSGNTLVYNGPAPETDDVQNFKLHFWDNLAQEERCGQCHNGSDASAPAFVQVEDINAAYTIANNYVDLAAPPLSAMVTQFSETGHFCWRGEQSVCADTITNFIENWASASGAEANEVVLTAPPEILVADSKSFPAETSGFETTVYPLLTQYCVNCHSEGSATQQQPYLASTDIEVAYQAARSRINLDTPAQSRLVGRLLNDSHNCWSSCPANATEMQTAIQAFSDGIPLTEVNPALVVSRALGLPNGIIASSGGRFESNVIALYEFKTGAGATAFDTSGIDPSADFRLDVDPTADIQWLGAFGLRINNGRAQVPVAGSEKLYNMITSTGEFSIEAWVVPDNVAQDGPARIVTYSGGNENGARNFTLGQTTYDYNFWTRTSLADPGAVTELSTPSADEVLQATLQHVVVNFDPIDGRSIYVNGENVAENTAQPGNLNDWDPTFAFAIGAEVDGDDQWQGAVRFLAIHNRTLSEEEIVQNFDVGVGQKFFLLFGISHLVDIPQAYVVFEVQQFDDYAYLFNRPFFVSLDSDFSFSGDLVMRNMRVGLNGQEVGSGQTYANLNATINASNYSSGQSTELSALGALIPIDKGTELDQFFLSFDFIDYSGDALDQATYDRPEDPAPPSPDPVPAGEQSDIGVRTFDEVYNTLSVMSTVPVSNPMVMTTFESVRQALPVSESVEGFLASHQSGVMQLSVAYCTELVDTPSLRTGFFPGFDFSADYSTAFADDAGRDLIVTPLIEAMLAHEVDDEGTITSLASVQSPEAIREQLRGLIGSMNDTRRAVISTCSAAFGSAVMMVQ